MLVQIGRRHRADFETDLERCNFASYTAVIDLQPEFADSERGTVLGRSQCRGCNFLQFLDSIEDLSKYYGLAQIRRVFRIANRLSYALASGDQSLLQQTCAEVGVSWCFEIMNGAAAPRYPSLERIVVVSKDGLAQLRTSGVRTDYARGAYLVVEPNQYGPSWVLDQIRLAVQAGYERIQLGYLGHANAMENWNAFCEREAFAEEWGAMLVSAQALGVNELSFAMAYPACASLQWRANLPLEGLRARLDMQFRVVEHESSMMCPENVSGYALCNEMREFWRTNVTKRRRFAVRIDDVLLGFDA